jgi:hypothetical protein
VAEKALDDALELVPRRRRSQRLGDALLAELVRHSRGEAEASPNLPEQLGALRALPRRQRAALVLSHYTELSDDRAAMFLGCSPRAVADLASRAIRALPAEARTDVHDWLDSAPLPRALPVPPGKPLLRRLLRPRLLRAGAAVVAVAAGVLGGLRVPALLQEAEPPTRAERLADVRREIELMEASLPFDPDDPGPGASRMFPVDNGVIGGSLWNVAAYRDTAGSACLQLVVAPDFGSRRCLTESGAAIRAVVDLDRAHDATFIAGVLSPEVDSLEFVGPTVSFMDVAIGREDPGARGAQRGFFGIVLTGELVHMDPREADRDGYEIVPGRLTARDAQGKKVAVLSIPLAEA